MKDDETGEALEQRADDQPEALKDRLKGYHSQTVPILEHYEPRGVTVRVDANRDLADIAGSVDSAIASIQSGVIVS